MPSTKTVKATLALMTCATLVGCSNNASTLDALRTENQELRDENGALEAALLSADERVSLLTQERERLGNENAQLAAQLASAPAGNAGTTAFDGMEGVRSFTRGSELVVEVRGDILFDSGQVKLKTSAKQRLDEIARVIKGTYPTNMIRIAGHTDSQPIRKSKWGTNERLAAERALAVEEFLAERGISKNRMYAAAMADADPKQTAAASRRVEIIILAETAP